MDPQTVYNNLYNLGTVCDQANGSTYRICINEPTYSKLLSKPLLEDPPDGLSRVAA